ncbi:ACT domain-containing protein [Streptomyces sp. NBC_00485]
MRRDDTAEDGWVALWNGDDAHDPEATGMLSAIVAPLAASGLPVWTAASYDGDLVLVPAGRLEEAVGASPGRPPGGRMTESGQGQR